MKLSIALAAASVILRWQTPGPGAWALFSRPVDDLRLARIEASGYTTNNAHVVFNTGRDSAGKIYWAVFEPAK